MIAVPIRLNDRSYETMISCGILEHVGDEIAKVCRGRTAVLVTEPQISALYGQKVLQSLTTAGFRTSIIEIAGGERCKTLATATSLYDSLLDANVDRSGVVVSLGGGIVGDLAGFVAATYLRSIDFVQIPTTLLAQVDASVGGKVGVNLPRGKNLVGTFHQPRKVLVDPDVLASLPKREFACGLAEVIKYGIISDRELVYFVKSKTSELKQLDRPVLTEIIARCCEIKADIVSKDERESGLRVVLNLGHTVGHGIEAATDFGAYSHGEAVSIGMVTAALIAESHGMAEIGLAKEIAGILDLVHLPVKTDEVDPADIIRAISYDKKIELGKLRFVLPKKIGEVEIVDSVTSSDIVRALANQRQMFA